MDQIDVLDIKYCIIVQLAKSTTTFFFFTNILHISMNYRQPANGKVEGFGSRGKRPWRSDNWN